MGSPSFNGSSRGKMLAMSGRTTDSSRTTDTSRVGIPVFPGDQGRAITVSPRGAAKTASRSKLLNTPGWG